MSEPMLDDPRVMDAGGIPIIKEYAPLALNGPPTEPGLPVGVAGPTHDSGVLPATRPSVAVPPSATALAAGALQAKNVIPGMGPPGASTPSVAPVPPKGGSAGDFAKPTPPAAQGPLMGTTTETTTSRTKGVKASKESLDALDESFRQEERAIQAAARSGAEQAAAEGAFLRQRDAELAERTAANQAREAEHRTALEEQETKVGQAMDDFRSKKLDPEQYWKERGTGAKVTSAIAMALGQFGAALTGTRNSAMDIINDAINRNIEAQKQEIANARENVNLEQNVMAQLRQKGLDEREAEHAARQLYLEGAQQQLETIAAGYKSEAIKNNAAQASAQLGQKRADAAVQRSIASQDRVTVQSQSTTAPLKGAAGGAQQLPAGEAAKLGEASAAVKNVNELYAKWDKDASGVTGWLASFLPATDASRYDDNRRAAAQVIGSYLEGGKLTESDLARYMKMLPSSGESEKTASNKRDAIVRLVSNRQSGEKKALGAAGYNVAGIDDAAPQVSSFKPR